MTVTSGLTDVKDKERQQRIQSDIRWVLKGPESGNVAQARGRPASGPRLEFAENMRAQSIIVG